MSDSTLVGKIGRVTGTVRTGRQGEVMLAVGDRVEAYFAVAYDGEETIAPGSECVVVEPHPQLSRTVLVTAYPGET
jgi:hypothetical protein